MRSDDPVAARGRSLAGNRSGALFVEFLFVFLPFMGLIFGLCQSALLYLGGLAVQRSASVAARAAIVVLDDDPRRYGGQPRNQASGARLRAIETAAGFPILALDASPLGDANSVSQALRAWRENPLTGAVRSVEGLRVGIRAGARRGKPVTVHVTYEFRCEVPMARVFMCGGGTVRLEAESTLPSHASTYTYGVW